MSELNQTFAELFAKYREIYPITVNHGGDRSGILKNVPKGAGVYVIARQSDLAKPLYIGSSGKVSKGLKASPSNIYKRLMYASTPYKFDGTQLHYGPTTATVPPHGYTDSADLNELQITCFKLPASTIPSALEHLLIQGFVNEFGDLPLVNQKA